MDETFKWQELPESSKSCTNCILFNLGKDNIWAVGVYFQGPHKFKLNLNTSTFEFKQNTKTRMGSFSKEMAFTTIPLKYVIDDCKRHF